MDVTAAENFKQEVLPWLLQQNEKHNIFNADETRLYIKGLPDRGYDSANEKLSGGKKAKERVTFLVCANMSGAEKKEIYGHQKIQASPLFFQRHFNFAHYLHSLL